MLNLPMKDFIAKLIMGIGASLSLVGLTMPALAVPFIQTLNVGPQFSASQQSYFGPGRIEGTFNESGSIGNSTLGASFVATSGTGDVTGLFGTEIQVSAPTVVSDGREFDINLDWLGSRLIGVTTFAAGFDLDLFALSQTVSIVSESVSVGTLGLSKVTPGTFFSTTSARDCEDITAVSVNVIVGSGKIGGSVCVTQEPRWNIVAIEGELLASLVGSTSTQLFDFRLDSSMNEKVSVNLPSDGTWEFSFTKLSLENQFGSDFLIEAGVFGEVCIILLGCDTERLLEEVATVNSGDFPLTWTNINPIQIPSLLGLPGGGSLENVFSITRQVPEPESLVVFSIGLFCLLLVRSRRVHGSFWLNPKY